MFTLDWTRILTLWRLSLYPPSFQCVFVGRLDLSVTQLMAFARGGRGAKGAAAQNLQLKNRDGAENRRRSDIPPTITSC